MELFRRVARDEASPTSSVRARPSSTVAKLKVAKTSALKRDAIPQDSQGFEPGVLPLSESASLPSAERDKKDNSDLPDIWLSSSVAEVAIDDIEANPYQPRRSFDEAELSDLANSIREHGIIQPIVVRPSRSGSKPFQLVAGERRWRASQRAGLTHLPAIVRPVDDLQALELALIENVQRHDISAIDAAIAYRRLADEFRLSQEDIARRVGKSRSAVANTLRLLDLQPEIRQAIEQGQISEGHGRAILLAQGEGARRALFRRLVRDHLSVREIERLAKDVISDDDQKVSISPQKSGASHENEKGDLDELISLLQKKLGARLDIKPKRQGGCIVIEYSNDSELRRLTAILSR